MHAIKKSNEKTEKQETQRHEFIFRFEELRDSHEYYSNEQDRVKLN